MAGLVACPSDHPLLKSSVEGARKILARPIQPKEPLPFSIVQKIAEHYSSKDSLASIRFLFVLLVGYAGFSGIDELQNMMLKDVVISSDRMSVFTPKRKND